MKIELEDDQLLEILMERSHLRQQVRVLQERNTQLVNEIRERTIAMPIKIKAKWLKDPMTILPKQATSGSSGFDLHAAETTTIPARGRVAVGTDLSMEIPSGYIGKIASRSGLAFKHGVSAWDGNIDSDYRGEVRVLMVNLTDEPFQVESGMRIAQLLVVPALRGEFELVENLSLTGRGDRGFGSTGLGVFGEGKPTQGT